MDEWVLWIRGNRRKETSFTDINPSKWNHSRGQISVIKTTSFLFPLWNPQNYSPKCRGWVRLSIQTNCAPNTWRDQGRPCGWESQFWHKRPQWFFELYQIFKKPTPPQVRPSSMVKVGQLCIPWRRCGCQVCHIVWGKVGYGGLIGIGEGNHKTVLTAT